jgi:arylformamidase
MRIIDLSLPINPGHVRWSPEITMKGDLEGGDLFQVTTLKVSCHSYTHVDAQRHYFAGKPTIEQTPLDALVGPATVIDLTDAEPNDAIDAERIAARAGNLAPKSRIILKSAWHRHRSIDDEAFWRDAPYLTRDAAEWLLAQNIMTVCYDFPQDYVIRCLLDGDIRPIEEHVTHDVLLRNGVHMVEYLTNTAEITAPSVFLSAAPLKIPNGDGSPARVYVIEGLNA